MNFETWRVVCCQHVGVAAHSLQFFVFCVFIFFSVFYSIIMLFGFAVVCGALCASDFLEGFQFVPRLLLNCLPLLLPVFQSFVCIL